MSRFRARRALLALTVLVAALAGAGGVALASASHHSRRGLSLAQVVRYQSRSARSAPGGRR